VAGNGIPIEGADMRIESRQTFAGFPAIQIRRLMRETVGRSISLRCVREVLQCSDSTAASVLVDVQREILVIQVEDHLEPSMKCINPISDSFPNDLKNVKIRLHAELAKLLERHIREMGGSQNMLLK
jgi:hypothetical protein